MNPEQQAAYINAMAASALVEALGMAAANEHSKWMGDSPSYKKNDFDALIEKYGIHHNAVAGWFRS